MLPIALHLMHVQQVPHRSHNACTANLSPMQCGRKDSSAKVIMSEGILFLKESSMTGMPFHVT